MATMMQRIAVEKLAEIVRKSKGQKKVTMGKILRAAGYSEAVANHPTHVTERKGFKELLEELIPDSKISEKLHQQLNSVTLDSYTMSAKMTDKEIEEVVSSIPNCKVRKIVRDKLDKKVHVYFWRPDNLTVDKTLDKLIRIKGHYAPEKSEVEHSGEVNVIEVNNYGSSKKSN